MIARPMFDNFPGGTGFNYAFPTMGPSASNPEPIWRPWKPYNP